jgi:tetratricopeptide (TPR) repeat protein
MPPDRSERRKYPRIRTYKGVRVTWKASGKIKTARVENIGLGGIFLQTPNPVAERTSIEVILALPTGQVCARAIVRRSLPGRGMGLQFVQMVPEDRTKLNRYVAEGQASQKTAAAAGRGGTVPTNSCPARREIIVAPRREEMAQLRFEREVRQLSELTGSANYSQLLGVTSDSTAEQIRKNYHSLARRFHPDYHAGDGGSGLRLKELMAVVSQAYKTLEDEEKRAAYDKSLLELGVHSIHRAKAGSDESIEGWLRRANQCLRAKNSAGSVVWLRKCAEPAPQHVLYHAMLARSLATIPQCRNEAVEHFQRAIDLNPLDEKVYFQFAELFEEMGLPSRARAIYAKLFDYSPGNPKASERLAAIQSVAKSEKAPALISQIFSRKR